MFNKGGTTWWRFDCEPPLVTPIATRKMTTMTEKEGERRASLGEAQGTEEQGGTTGGLVWDLSQPPPGGFLKGQESPKGLGATPSSPPLIPLMSNGGSHKPNEIPSSWQQQPSGEQERVPETVLFMGEPASFQAQHPPLFEGFGGSLAELQGGGHQLEALPFSSFPFQSVDIGAREQQQPSLTTGETQAKEINGVSLNMDSSIPCLDLSYFPLLQNNTLAPEKVTTPATTETRLSKN
jgi:hypothetical protein